MQKLGASLHAGTLQFLGGYVLGFLNAIGVMLTRSLPLTRPCSLPPTLTLTL